MVEPAAPASAPHPWRRGLFAVFSAVVFIVAARVLIHAFRSANWKAVEGAIFQWRGRFLLAIALCSLSFATVGLIEWRGLRWAGRRVSDDRIPAHADVEITAKRAAGCFVGSAWDESLRKPRPKHKATSRSRLRLSYTKDVLR